MHDPRREAQGVIGSSMTIQTNEHASNDEGSTPFAQVPQQQEMPLALVRGEPVLRDAAGSVHPAGRARGHPGGVRRAARPAAVPDPPAEPRHPRHPDRRDHPPVRRLHRDDAGAAARARRRIPGDGRDPGRDQIAHAAAAAADSRKVSRTTRAPSWCAACRNTSASRRPPRTSTRCRAWTATSRRSARSSRTAT